MSACCCWRCPRLYERGHDLDPLEGPTVELLRSNLSNRIATTRYVCDRGGFVTRSSHSPRLAITSPHLPRRLGGLAAFCGEACAGQRLEHGQRREETLLLARVLRSGERTLRLSLDLAWRI